MFRFVKEVDIAVKIRYKNYPEAWNMYTFVWDSENDFIGTYVNGVLRGSYSSDIPALDTALTVSQYGLGNWEWASNLPGGWYKDFRIYDTALNEEHIQNILGDTLLYPGSPSPKNQQNDVALDSDLTWTNGLESVYQNVYFGTDLSAVSAADTNSPEFKAQIGLENTYDPGQLDMYRTYYWRVDQLDENGELIVKGKVWRFHTIESYMVDDFEAYDYDANKITNVWIDPSGDNYMSVQLVQDPVLSPINTMKLNYSNIFGDFYSEAKRTFSTPQDWTRNGIKVLGINIFGQEANLDQPLYVTIEDSAGNKATVNHPDTAVTTIEQWKEWKIDLTAVSGIDLTQVQSLTIGTGDGEHSGHGWGDSDDLFIDDISLYPSHCVQEYGPTADVTGDCKVNYEDIAQIAKGWLKENSSETTITAANPVGLWLFDDEPDLLKATIGNDLTSGIYGGTGGPITAAEGITASDGAAMIPQNTYLQVDHGIAPDANKVNEYTLVWDVKIPAESAYAPLKWVALGEYDTNDLATDVDISVIYNYDEVNYDDGLFGTHKGWSEPVVKTDKWYQLAVSVDNGQFYRCYVNGDLVVETAPQEIDGRYSLMETFHLFKDNENEDPDIYCSAFAIFDRALNSEEIAELTTATILDGDLNEDTNIDFIDYAIIADQWMDEILWP